MLNGPAIFRVSFVLLVAGALAALVQYFLPSSTPAPPPASEAPVAAPAPPAIRRIPTAPPPAAPTVEPVPAPTTRPPGTTAEVPAPVPIEAPRPVPAPPALRGEAEIAEAETSEGPPAIALLDLNSASAADLNRLRGGGSIGRAIVAKRPYSAVSDLLTKRVLSRSTYERIKDQVTVR